jgi:hypothetical protein
MTDTTTTTGTGDLGLGEVQDSYPVKRLGKKIMINWTMVVISTLMVVTIPLAVWFLIITLRSPDLNVRSRARRVDVHEHGVVLVDHTGPIASFRFDSMSVLQEIKVVVVNGIRTSKHTRYTLTGADGQLGLVNEAYERIERFGDAVQAGVVRSQLAGALAAARAGQQVPFGRLVVTGRELTTPKGSLAWPQVRLISISNGQLAVHAEGKKLALYRMPVRQIPNLQLLLSTAGALRKPTG